MTRKSKLLFLVGFLFAACPAPPTPPPACGIGNCLGCCDVTGVCQFGGSVNACGSSGLACTSCGASLSCQSGVCVSTQPTTDAGTDAGPTLKGELAIEWSDSSGAHLDRHSLHDFGSALEGTPVSGTVRVRNIGSGPIVLASIVRVSGDDVFRVSLDAGLQLAPDGGLDLDSFFEPPLTDGGVHSYQAQLRLTATGAPSTPLGTALLDFVGNSVPAVSCPALFTGLNFGPVARGDSFSLTFVITNPNAFPIVTFVGNPTGVHAAFFTFAPTSPSGSVTLPPGAAQQVELVFRPTESRDYLATLTLVPSAGCPAVQGRLSGSGVASVLSWSPATLDFGYVPPGVAAPFDVTFQNLSLRAVQLTVLATREGANPSTHFRVVRTDSTDLTRLTVPPAVIDLNQPSGVLPGTITAGLTFTPSVLGPRAGQLTASTGLATQPNVSVNLRGVGGGPDIDVRPTVLDFGRIAYFPGANPASNSNRKLTVSNVGTRPTPADPRANLKLGPPPYWSVTPVAGSSLSEICVGFFDTSIGTCTNDLPASTLYDPAIGIVAAGTPLDIPIRITPNGPGARAFDVRIFSNDPDEPITTIRVTANAVTLPPCDLEVTPASLDFGLISASSELTFSLRNRGSGVGATCLISNLQILPTASVFSFSTTTSSEFELAPGEMSQFKVRAFLQGAFPVTPQVFVGQLSLEVSRPVMPLVQLPLAATIGQTCLVISPSTFDFGTAATSCNTPNRTFQIINTCFSTVVINSSVITPAAGEFLVVTGLPPGTQLIPGAAPVTFQLKYRPTNLGFDFGTFTINATTNGQARNHVLPLQGTGATTGLNTDAYSIAATNKADVLLVVDDSCSMFDKQNSLGANLPALLQYATSAATDFHLGVTNTELSGGSSAMAGTLHATNGVKILTSVTPNLSVAFGNLVRGVGTTGSVESCLVPAIRALTAPNVNDPTKNAGFLRSDAVLGVICVTDARDQAPQTAGFYLNQLQNIKGAQRPGQFTYSVIGPFLPSAPVSCSYDDPNDGKHAFIAAQTGGVTEEICTLDWPTVLGNVGKTAFGYRLDYALLSSPDLSSMISVMVDGVPVPAFDGLGSPVWQYDPVRSAIRFAPLYVPEPGRTLTIGYQALCVP